MTKVVYTVTNKETKQVYVGITSSSIEDRKKDQIGKSKLGKKGKFYEAIGTYSPSAFIWEQIDTASSNDELAKKEKEYVLEYNSKEEGYNSDEGGGVKKTVYQYDLEGNHIESFDCLEDAGIIVGAKKQQISRACLNKKTSKGFYWSYDYAEKFVPPKDLRKKQVYQFTLIGDLVTDFESVSEASKATGFNKSSIAKVCRGERQQCFDYIWRYV